MRWLYWREQIPLTELADQYNVSVGAVYDAVDGRSCQHLPMPPKEIQEQRERRTERGTNHPRSKLNDEMVYRIRVERKGDATYAVLSERFGVSEGNIGFICRGETWEHVPMPT